MFEEQTQTRAGRPNRRWRAGSISPAALMIALLVLLASPPSAAFAVAEVELGAPNASITEGQAFTRSGSVSIPSDSIWDTLQVDYGDPPGAWETLDRQTSFTVSHVYPDDGTYSVVVRATGVTDTFIPDLGHTLPLPWAATDQVDVAVANVAPVVASGPDAGVTAATPFTRVFAFSDPGDDTWVLRVDWGDGTTDSVPNMTNHSHEFEHTYAQPGDYPVQVRVVDDDGGEDQAGFTLTATMGPGRPFTDVPPDHRYSNAIEWMAGMGIVDGYVMPDGSAVFRPENSVLRAQFAKIAVGYLLLECREDMTSPFQDLGPDAPHSLYPHEYVAAAHANGITKGTTAATFSPYVPISRAQVLTMVVRAWQRLFPHLLENPPADYVSTWGTGFSADHGRNTRVAEYNGMLAGIPLTGQAADPWAPMPRGEVVQVLWNARTLLP